MKKNKVLIILLSIGVIILTAMVLTYFVIVPAIVSNNKIMNNICKMISKDLPVQISIENPNLKTHLNSDIVFKARKIKISKDKTDLFEVNNLQSGVKLSGLLKKKLIVNTLGAEYVYADINKLMDSFPSEENLPAQENDFGIDLYNSILDLQKSLILYSPKPDCDIKVAVNEVNIDNTNKKERYVHFNIDTEIKNKDEILSFKIADENKVLIKNKHLYINDCIFKINNSNVHINAEGSNEKGLDLNVSSKKFKIEDVTDLIETDLVIPNGSEILSFFNNLNGDFDFDIDLTKKGMQGKVVLNNGFMRNIPLNNMPLKVNSGIVQITPETLALKDFSGYYGKNPLNKAVLYGTVKDYVKSVETEINIDTAANNEFARDYLSPIAGIPLEIVQAETKAGAKAGTKIIVKAIYDKIDIILMSKLAKGDDILVDGVSLTPVTYDRAVKADMHVEGKYLDLREVNYYIAQELKKGSKVKPVVTLRGRFDITKEIPDMKAFGFEIPDPLPSEFLNVLAGQKLFKGGKFQGKLYIVNENENPVIKGKITSNDIRIPSQRIFIKKADLYTDNDTIHITSNGRFKRSNFTFAGDIKSSIKYPIVIRNLDFELDKMNLEKLMNSFNQAPQTDIAQNNATDEGSGAHDDNVVTFDTNNIIIEKCIFRLKEGSYKDINFGNLIANLTLKDNKLDLHSNKFDIAEGISAVKVLCDLNKHKYYLRLGVKDVNSDIMTTTLLNLPREISGKASGLIEINTDDSMKLNGQIKFAINNGQIQKIGLVEYLMKFASLFRNPLVTISPSIFSDIVNIPEGNFDKISGELYIDNNFVKLLKIRSSSPQLSSYIVGCYNLENSDAILRIYTKFSNKNKGAAGFLRKFSLASLANKMPLSSRNDSNYYAAELKNLPEIDADERDVQIFLTSVDGDIEHNNFLSSLKKIK